MNPRFSWLIGIVVGAILGYLFGVRSGDLWFGSVLAVCWTIAVFGFLAFPEYRSRWSGPHSTIWYMLVAVLTPIVMLIPPNSVLLADALPIVVLLGGIWLGGVYAGVALERDSTDGHGG